MIQVAPQMRILVAVETVDFRKGIDGLVGVCRRTLQMDPFSGYLFVFRNRGGTSIKILMYDGQGYWLCQKRLSKGRFQWWPNAEDGAIKNLAANQLQTLLWNGDPERAKAPLWKKISSTP
jgi:transposase